MNQKNKKISYINDSRFCICLSLFFLILLSIIYNFVNAYNNIWFKFFHYFTNQSAILTLIFSIYYMFYFITKKKFHINIFFYCVIINDALTMFIWNFAFITNAINIKPTIFEILNNIIVHIISPILVIVFFNISTSKKDEFKPMKFKKIYIWDMVYVYIYITYIILLPFISTHTVYGPTTNFNPWLVNTNMTHGSFKNLIFILFAIILFNIVLTIFWYINKRLVNKHSK